MKVARILMLAAVLAGSLATGRAVFSQERYLVARIDGEGWLRDLPVGLEVIQAEPDLVLGAAAGTLEELTRRLGESWEILGPLADDRQYYVATATSSDALREADRMGTVVSTRGKHAVFWAAPTAKLALPPPSLTIREVPQEPIVLGKIRQAPVSQPWDPLIAHLVQRVDQQEVEGVVRRLEAFRTRHTYTDSCRAAAEYIVERLRVCGLDSVGLDVYASDKAPNVVGTLPGTTTAGRVFILCGHYDSISDSGSDTLAPGADDNGSGTAAVLEACRVLAPFQFESTLRFIAFSGEEQGLLGSRYYADSLYQAGDSVAGVLNFDMVGYDDPEPPREDLEIYTEYQSEFLADLLFSAGEDFTSLVPHKTVLPVGGSDHYSFWARGYPAILAIEEPGSSRFWNPYYHSVADTTGTLSVSFLADVARAAVATAAQLAGPLSRFFSPSLSVTPGDRRATLNWGNEPEVYDTLSAFEGYRVYRSAPDTSNPVLLAQYDIVNAIPPNTGLVHSYVDSMLSNGFPYWYAVTAFDTLALETSRTNWRQVFPIEVSPQALREVRAVPNPYKPGADWVGQGWGEGVHFENLPDRTTIRIFTLGGDLVRVLPFERSEDGRPCTWDLKNERREMVGAGVYLFGVEAGGRVMVGKLVIVR